MSFITHTIHIARNVLVGIKFTVSEWQNIMGFAAGKVYIPENEALTKRKDYSSLTRNEEKKLGLEVGQFPWIGPCTWRGLTLGWQTENPQHSQQLTIYWGNVRRAWQAEHATGQPSLLLSWVQFIWNHTLRRKYTIFFSLLPKVSRRNTMESVFMFLEIYAIKSAILTDIGKLNSLVSPFPWWHREDSTYLCSGLTPPGVEQKVPYGTLMPLQASVGLCQSN